MDVCGAQRFLGEAPAQLSRRFTSVKIWKIAEKVAGARRRGAREDHAKNWARTSGRFKTYRLLYPLGNAVRHRSEQVDLA
jgi:hypothetical protein